MCESTKNKIKFWNNRTKIKKLLDAEAKSDYSNSIAVLKCSITANKKKGGRKMKYAIVIGNAEMNKRKVVRVQTVCLARKSER